MTTNSPVYNLNGNQAINTAPQPRNPLVPRTKFNGGNGQIPGDYGSTAAQQCVGRGNYRMPSVITLLLNNSGGVLPVPFECHSFDLIAEMKQAALTTPAAMIVNGFTAPAALTTGEFGLGATYRTQGALMRMIETYAPIIQQVQYTDDVGSVRTINLSRVMGNYDGNVQDDIVMTLDTSSSTVSPILTNYMQWVWTGNTWLFITIPAATNATLNFYLSGNTTYAGLL